LCSASFFGPTVHARARKDAHVGVRCPPFTLQRMPNMKRHHRWCFFLCSASFLHLSHTEHDNTPRWCYFVLGSLSCPLEGDYYFILCIIKYLLYILNQYILILTEPAGFSRESRTRGRGTGILRVRVRVSPKLPAGHPCPSLCEPVRDRGYGYELFAP